MDFSIINAYLDGNNLVCPEKPIPPDAKRGSDNGTLHLSRWIMATGDTARAFAINPCIDAQGYVHRAPDDPSEDAPDDYYGVISLLAYLGLKIKVTLPWTHMHPALLQMRGMQRGNLFAHLFSGITALIIAFSNYNEDLNATGNRLLTWNLIKGTEKSFTCRLGAKFWYARQRKLYGLQNPVQQMSKVYYEPGHPITQVIE